MFEMVEGRVSAEITAEISTVEDPANGMGALLCLLQDSLLLCSKIDYKQKTTSLFEYVTIEQLY